ncbi:MAG: hypothetical protein HQM08_15860 [Candidatus Riflebacteria bacterium]|nr:hypothetical protein [Candidatus Riflebacteria bacterium]
MYRITAITGVCLFVTWLFCATFFSEGTKVSWNEISLFENEMKVRLTNSGDDDWERFTIAVRVSEDGKVTAFNRGYRGQKLGAGLSSLITLPLNRKLLSGKQYAVKIFLQKGRAKVVDYDCTKECEKYFQTNAAPAPTLSPMPMPVKVIETGKVEQNIAENGKQKFENNNTAKHFSGSLHPSFVNVPFSRTKEYISHSKLKSKKNFRRKRKNSLTNSSR